MAVARNVRRNPLYKDSQLNPFVGAKPGNVVVFQVSSEDIFGKAPCAWYLRNIRSENGIRRGRKFLEYDFERIPDGYPVALGVHWDGSGFKPNAEIYKKI